MIQKLSIRNFKSIRALDLDCRRVNVFIGEPNTGKTNILEGLGLRCAQAVPFLSQVTRCQILADLFWEQDVVKQIEVNFDSSRLYLSGSASGALAQVREGSGGMPSDAYRLGPNFEVTLSAHLRADVLYYLFSSNTLDDDPHPHWLLPPYGQNLASLLYSSKQARAVAAGFFESTGYKLQVDLAERRIRVTRSIDDVMLSIPYSSVSETLRRMVFYTLAMETNQGRVLVLDEPEAHSFPPYTKTLAERIALDEKGNQYFLTTHSPYMLDSLLSKTPASELNVVLCRMENFETKAYPMNQDQIDQIKEWSMDAFFNFDRLLPELK